ncbi:MAG: hypothetical protein ACKPJC_10850 [Microcystis panniformis]
MIITLLPAIAPPHPPNSDRTPTPQKAIALHHPQQRSPFPQPQQRSHLPTSPTVIAFSHPQQRSPLTSTKSDRPSHIPKQRSHLLPFPKSDRLPTSQKRYLSYN